MNYTPDALDVEKMDKLFNNLERGESQKRAIEMAKTEAFYQGYNKAIHDCRSALYCSNYERKIPTATEIERNVFYEICKELDIMGSDIYDAVLGTDEKAARLAERIRDELCGDTQEK